jgi:hypothetical protein
MPENIIGWLMFTFFAVGAAGGWVILVLWLREMLREVWK